MTWIACAVSIFECVRFLHNHKHHHGHTTAAATATVTTRGKKMVTNATETAGVSTARNVL